MFISTNLHVLGRNGPDKFTFALLFFLFSFLFLELVFFSVFPDHLSLDYQASLGVPAQNTEFIPATISCGHFPAVFFV